MQPIDEPRFAGSRMAMLILLLGTIATARGAERWLDAFADRGDAAARARWQAGESTPPVRTAAGGGLLFDCPFGRLPADRFYWDREVRLDLSADTGFSLDLSCAHPEALRALALYFRSGDGWYIWSRPLPQAGRQRLYLARSDFSKEGTPAGWHRIDGIRLSPWRGSVAVDTRLQLYGLRAVSHPVLLVRGTVSLPNDGERAAARRATRTLERRLTALGVPHGIIDEDALTAAVTTPARMLILPYNPTLPDRVFNTLNAFFDRGGKALVFYSADARLAQRMGFDLGDYQAARRPMQWSAFTFMDPATWRVPERILQESWNLRPVTPARPDAEIIAWWEDADGVQAPEPAWVASRDGAWMTHILQDGDNNAKEDLLAALLTRWAPELWPAIADTTIQRADQVGSFRTLPEAVSTLRERSRSRPATVREAVAEKLALATHCLDRARQAVRAERYSDAYSLARACRRQLTEAMALTLSARPNEFRGVWDHHAVGWYPGDWERTARLLREAGLTAIFPNVAWGGLAHYASETLPRSSTFEQHGDQLATAIAAARRHNLELHAWIVCWNLGNPPATFLDRMRREGRLQRDAQGRELAWLCPAHPDNRRHTLDIIREIADARPHGVHLDYIRFPGANACYCDTCRRQIEERLGRPLTDWPAAAIREGPVREAWRRHRTETITRFVRQARQAVKATDPDRVFSAAVFGNYPAIIATIGQDWGAWLREDVLDAVVPMNYTADPATFRRWLDDQRAGPAAGKRLLAGIGISSGEAPLTPDQVLDQIGIVRELDLPGYVLFALDIELREHLLPLLRLGAGGQR